MIPQMGQHVKCLLRNSSLIEGVVEEWSTKQVRLKSLDEESILIIMRPDEDIVLIKIMVVKTKPTKLKTNLEEEFKETYDLPSNDELRIQKLAELKQLLIKQDKQIIASKIKSHNLGEVKKVDYEYPKFFSK